MRLVSYCLSAIKHLAGKHALDYPVVVLLILIVSILTLKVRGKSGVELFSYLVFSFHAPWKPVKLKRNIRLLLQDFFLKKYLLKTILSLHETVYSSIVSS